MEVKKVIAKGYQLPPFWDKKKVQVVNVSDGTMQLSNNSITPSQYPLTFKAADKDPFTFPIDPIITLNFKNIIIRRNVAKGKYRGSVKERWSEDDVDITISGVLINTEDETAMPKELDELRKYCQLNTSIEVECSLLNGRDIFKIAIESLNLPATKGQNNQTYEIKAYSDDIFELLIDENV